MNYARALAHSGRRGDAIGELREVLRRQPDWQPAEQDLIRLLAADADPALRSEAVALAEKLVQRTAPPDAELLATLAVAYEGVAPLADALGGSGATPSPLPEPVAAPICSRASKPRERRALERVPSAAHPDVRKRNRGPGHCDWDLTSDGERVALGVAGLLQ